MNKTYLKSSVAKLGIKILNKAFQSDNLQAVRFAVSLSLNFTAKRPSYKLRLKAAFMSAFERTTDRNTLKYSIEHSSAMGTLPP
ncbi:hypothetical protein OAM69_06175, partial [bacterium]|nr:hypothetical protein [bacterium]